MKPLKESIFGDIEDIANSDSVLIEQFLKDNYEIHGTYVIKNGMVDVKGYITVKNKNIKSSSKKRKKKVIDKISDSSQLIDSSTLKPLDRKKVRAKVKKMVIEQNVLF